MHKPAFKSPNGRPFAGSARAGVPAARATPVLPDTKVIFIASRTRQLLNSAHLQLPYAHGPDPDIAGSYRGHCAGGTQRRAPAIRVLDGLPYPGRNLIQ